VLIAEIRRWSIDEGLRALENEDKRYEKMKKALAVFSILVFFCVSVSAQTVVSKAGKLAWDDPNPAGAVTSFRVYVADTPGVAPDGLSFVAEVPGGTLEWTIASDVGSHHAVVTAVNDDGTTVIETGPSNEVHYVVIGPPGNNRALR
jgi:hypothetical protein